MCLYNLAHEERLKIHLLFDRFGSKNTQTFFIILTVMRLQFQRDFPISYLFRTFQIFIEKMYIKFFWGLKRLFFLITNNTYSLLGQCMWHIKNRACVAKGYRLGPPFPKKYLFYTDYFRIL